MLSVSNISINFKWKILPLADYDIILYTVKVHFSAREKIMQIGQNRPFEKFTRFLFMCLNVACITNIIWRDNNNYAIQIYATAAYSHNSHK